MDPEEAKKLDDKELGKLIKTSPYHKATSKDIDWVSKVKMQGSVQKWVDHSISVTVNVPENVTEELVSEIYQTAWESGCKGMTIYRENSRSGVLVSNEKKEEARPVGHVIENNAPPRPKELEADVVRFMNNKEEWVAVVGILNGRPYEIFTGKAEGFFLPKWVENGTVIKKKRKEKNQPTQYDFQFTDKDGYRITMEGLSRQFNKEYWNYAKLISGILRHGMPLPFVVDLVDNLQLDSESINTWKKGVVRTLKKYIPDGTIAKEMPCPECSEEGTLMYKEGCLTCSSCGYSKCG
jgi:ribonucleoside-diphosphate reductase alpha chain